MSYNIVAKGTGEKCFREFFSNWKTIREVSEILYPNSTSKTIPLVSKHFNLFLKVGYLGEGMFKETVRRRGTQEYTRSTRKFRGNLKPFIECAQSEKDVAFEHLEEKILAELVDNPWSFNETLPSINFREHVAQMPINVIDGLKSLFRDSIIYRFFVDYVWSTSKMDIKDIEIQHPKNDFYRLGQMLMFDEVLYTKVALTVFDQPLASMINLYPRHYILSPKGFLKVREMYEIVHKMYGEVKEKRRAELPEVYKRFEKEVQEQKEVKLHCI